MKNIKKTAIVLSTAGLMLFGAANMQAATQGSLGATSTGTVDVTLEIGKLLKISNLTDLMGAVIGTGSISLPENNICIFHNEDIKYSITLTSTPHGAYELKSGTDTVTYAIDWYDSPTVGSGTKTSIPYNTITALSGANQLSQDCSAGNNSASFNLIVATPGSVAGTYTGTLSILLEP